MDDQVIFETTLNIAAAERETGIGKDTLRIWERRYGFPLPARNDKGERSYTLEQVERLRYIKQLLDNGARPSQIVTLPLETLKRMLEEQQPHASEVLPPLIAEGMKLIIAQRSQQLEQWLEQQLKQLGIEPFVIELIAPMTATVGHYWLQQRLSIAAEHIFTAQVIQLLNAIIHQHRPRYPSAPKLLLATLPGEQHTLGLLMVETLLVCRGVRALSLGGQVPVEEIVRTAERHQIQSVLLSFSARCSREMVRTNLAALRRQLPQSVAIWAGGAGTQRLKPHPVGVQISHSLEDILQLGE